MPGVAVPQHLRPLAERHEANARGMKSIAIGFIVAAFVFGGFYLGGRLGSF